jgi:hypothetical protein
MPVQSRLETGFFTVVAEPSALVKSRVETGFFTVVAEPSAPAKSRVETGFFCVVAEESTGNDDGVTRKRRRTMGARGIGFFTRDLNPPTNSSVVVNGFEED